MKKKTIKKPSFLGVFLIRLLCAWIITAILGMGVYFYSDYVYVKVFDEEKDAVIEFVEEAYESYIVNMSTGTIPMMLSDGSDTKQHLLDSFHHNEKAKMQQKLAILYAKGIYCEVQFGDDIITPPGADEGNTTLLYYEGFMDSMDIVYTLNVPFDQLEFMCNNEDKLKDYGLSEFKSTYREQIDKLAFTYVNDNAVDNMSVPLWLFTDSDNGSSDPETTIRYVYVSELLTNNTRMTFVPLDLQIGEQKWTLENDVNEITSSHFEERDGYSYNDCNAMLVRYPEPSEHSFDTVIDKSRFSQGAVLPEGTMLFFDSSPTSILVTANLPADDIKYEIRMDYPDAGTLWEKDHSGVIIKNFCLWFFIAAVIAAVISIVSYSRKKSVYEIVEYRRKVTDSLAHDLKTPLMAISAFSETLDDCNDKEQSRHLTSKIRENVSAMNNMVEGVLDFSKSDREIGRVNRSDVNVRSLVKEQADSLMSLFDKRSVKVDIKPGDDVVIKSNEEILKRSVMNLLTNAAKFATSGSTVEIEITSAALSITNQTQEVIENIKDIKKPFVKGASSRGGENGTGLGLAIADSSLTALGHKLEVDLKDGKFTAVVKW